MALALALVAWLMDFYWQFDIRGRPAHGTYSTTEIQILRTSVFAGLALAAIALGLAVHSILRKQYRMLGGLITLASIAYLVHNGPSFIHGTMRLWQIIA